MRMKGGGGKGNRLPDKREDIDLNTSLTSCTSSCITAGGMPAMMQLQCTKTIHRDTSLVFKNDCHRATILPQKLHQREQDMRLIHIHSLSSTKSIPFLMPVRATNRT